VLELDGHALRWIRCVHVVAGPEALDSARWLGFGDDQPVVLRLSPDEALGLLAWKVEVDDADAIVEEDSGFAAGWCHQLGLDEHVEWRIPDTPGTLAQGAVAGVPAKIWIGDDEKVLLVTNAAYAAELADRIGWDR
jgi:hypothetical protein